MSIETAKLPKDPQVLSKIIDDHATRERYRLGSWRMMSILAFYYLSGIRKFTVLNPATGDVVPGNILDDADEGRLEYQAQDLISAVNRTSTYLAQYDLRPQVLGGKGNLRRQRHRAMTQVLMDQWVSEDQLFNKKIEFCHIMTSLGMCGITGHIVDHPTVGLTADLEIVHPMQLMPFPSLGFDYTRRAGMIRERVVNMETVERFYRVTPKMKEQLEYWEVRHGVGPEYGTYGTGTGTSIRGNWRSTPKRGSRSSRETQDAVQQMVRLRELWVEGPAGTCDRYIAQSGEAILADEDYSETIVYPSIGTGRFMENGTFHGQGIFQLLFPIVRQIERNVKQLFQNVRDIDQYGILVMPQGDMNLDSALRDVGRGLRVLPWDPDPVSAGLRPLHVQPFNSGDVPGKTASFGLELLDRINPLQDLVAEKGRVDSAVGLAFLDEQINQSMAGPSSGLRKAFSECWRSVADRGISEAVMSERPVRVQRLTLDLAGLVLDQNTDEVQMTADHVPEISELTFTVTETAPRSSVAKKQEALQLLEMGMSDPDAARIFLIEENLELATYMKEYEGAYENIVKAILVLYGDGENPGQWVSTPNTAKAGFQLRVLDGFLASPAMNAASPEVHDEFGRYREWLLYMLGQVLPEGMPNPDDVVAMREVERQLAEGVQSIQQAGQ